MIAKASADDTTRAERPMAAAVMWTMVPRWIPSTETSPAARPCSTERATIKEHRRAGRQQQHHGRNDEQSPQGQIGHRLLSSRSSASKPHLGDRDKRPLLSLGRSTYPFNIGHWGKVNLMPEAAPC